ncbi:MAG: outer membrane lipoprotein-sorting protein [Pseudomonadales bacterium]
MLHLLIGLAFAGDPTAEELLNATDDVFRGSSSEAVIEMHVKTKRYERTMRMKAFSQGVDKSLMVIEAPAKDAGVATLKVGDNLWNYLPKVDRTMKVPAGMMGGSWMGSHFTNDDLVKETQLIDAYDLALVEDESQYFVTLTPKAQTVTVWGKIEYVINKDPLLPAEQIFYDDDGTKVRVMTFMEPREYHGKLMPSLLEMKPLNKAGHRTLIIYDDIIFDVPKITEKTFSMRNLKSRF